MYIFTGSIQKTRWICTVLLFTVFLSFLLGCATIQTRPADYIEPFFEFSEVDNIAVLPVIDHRIDKSKALNPDELAFALTERVLKTRGYSFTLYHDRSFVSHISREMIEAPTRECIASLKPKTERWILLLCLEDSSSRLTFGSTGTAEMSGYLFDRSNARLIWRSKEIAQVGQGGLAGMMMKSEMEINAVRAAAWRVLGGLPLCKAGQITIINETETTIHNQSNKTQDQIEKPEDVSIKKVNLLDQAIHIGDDQITRFANPKPQSTVFTHKFNIADTILSRVSITIWISDMVPENDVAFAEGYYPTRLVINGNSIGSLNNIIHHKQKKPAIEQIRIEVDKSMFKKENNEIKIIGGHNSSNNHDDFQVHKIFIRYKTVET